MTHVSMTHAMTHLILLCPTLLSQSVYRSPLTHLRLRTRIPDDSFICNDVIVSESCQWWRHRVGNIPNDVIIMETKLSDLKRQIKIEHFLCYVPKIWRHCYDSSMTHLAESDSFFLFLIFEICVGWTRLKTQKKKKFNFWFFLQIRTVSSF